MMVSEQYHAITMVNQDTIKGAHHDRRDVPIQLLNYTHYAM